MRYQYTYDANFNHSTYKQNPVRTFDFSYQMIKIQSQSIENFGCLTLNFSSTDEMIKTELLISFRTKYQLVFYHFAYFEMRLEDFSVEKKKPKISWVKPRLITNHVKIMDAT